ncbi:MAG TPA: hypothetical protein VM577_06235 [Anaerovoracaceae bacterium]|nr:hypothetical protein [Anaerovoracaceae bacterium]
MTKRKLGDKIDWATNKDKVVRTVLEFKNGEVVGKAVLFENGDIQMTGQITDEVIGRLRRQLIKLNKKIG